MPPASAPLNDLRVLELAGLAPGPFCGLLLSSYGATVLRIDRPHPRAHSSTLPAPPPTNDLLTSHKSSICLDLKAKTSRALFLCVIEKADILIDPFRPGILEKLDLDPQTVLLKLNPRLIIARLTGFRRDGKYRHMAGHDINYLAVSGVLSMLGARNTPPLPPGSILADFAGGGMVAFTGILLALIHRGAHGKGQVVEANMVDGVSFLATFQRLGLKTPVWNGERGTNVLDGGCPFYGCYECRDAGKFVAVGALEPQFFAKLLNGLGLQEHDVLFGTHDRNDKRAWPYMGETFERKFKERTREDWEEIFDGTDSCVTPVLEMGELEKSGYEQMPVVRLVDSPACNVEDAWTGRGLRPGEDGERVLEEWLGWQKDRDFKVEQGTLTKISTSKL